jgi:endoglucanase
MIYTGELMDKTELLLQELADAYGAPGNEEEIARIMRRHLQPVSDKITFDKLGSIIAEKRGASDAPKVMIAGHMDEVAFVVRGFTKNGYVQFLPLGGWWGHMALAQRVIILTANGPVIGVIGSISPHILEMDARKKVIEVEDMFIDVGVREKFDAIKKLGITIGDAIVPYSPFTVMTHGKMYLGKAFDDRIGCAAVIEVMQKLAKAKLPNTLFGVGTVQEEVGLRGAGTAAYMCEPDVAIAIDVSPAKDTPGIKGEATEKLGAGAAIFVYDAGLVPNAKLKQLVIDTAKKNKIPYCLVTLQRGATDAGRIHMIRQGVPSICIAINARYIHAHTSVIYRDDYLNAVKLVTEVIKRLDKKTVQGLTQS